METFFIYKSWQRERCLIPTDGAKERVLELPQTSLRCIKNVSEKVLHLNCRRSITTKSVFIFIYNKNILKHKKYF